MKGVITGKEVMENLGILFKEFGPKVAFRAIYAVLSGKNCTFLEVVMA